VGNEITPLETFDLSKIMDEFSQQLMDYTVENQEQKSFPWNTSSTQKVSMECFKAAQSGQNVTISRTKAVDILNVLYEVDHQKETHTPYLGPSGITEWIITNLVSQFNNQGVINWLQQYSDETPISFYQRNLLVSDFISFCAKEIQIDVNAVDHNILSNPHWYVSYATKIRLNKNKTSMLRSLYRQFQPFNKIKIPHKTKAEAPSFCHPLVERHLQGLDKKGRTRATFNANKLACRDFLTWICRTYRQFTVYNLNDIPLHLINQSHLLEYRLFLKRQVSNKIMHEKTASTGFYYVRALFKTLHQLELLQNDVAADIKGLPFDNYHYRDIPNNEEIVRFFDVVRTYSPDPNVHLLLYSLMLNMGLRISEATSLSWENFNQSTWTLSFRGKDGKYNIMPIPAPIKSLIKQFSDAERNGPIVNKPPAAFIQHLYRYHQLYCQIADWTFENRGFHIFRHTYITKLSEHPQCTPKLLMALARHVKPASTSLYIHRSSDALRQAAEKVKYSFADVE